MPAKHAWTFKPRLRARAFGWNGTFRTIARKYPDRDPKKILLDLAASSGDPGRWFAAAKDVGFLDLAWEPIQLYSYQPVLARSAGACSTGESNEGATDMDKKKHDQALTGKPIAEKLVAKMKRRAHGKVVNLGDVIGGRAAARGLQKTVATKEDLAVFHPAHAAYVYAQNQVSVMSEQLTALKEMKPFDDIVSKAEDLYMPSAPPMSPLTKSYFTCWAFFDVCVGAANETIGATILELGAAFGIDSELLRLIRFCRSRGWASTSTRAGKIIWPFSRNSSPAPCAAPSFRPATAARRANCVTSAHSRRQSQTGRTIGRACRT